MKNKPPYAIDSVDHALHLSLLLQQEGSLRVTDAAERLGVSRSTAHRLLSMLVYRGFAEQGDDRRYRAGSVLRPMTVSEAPVSLLRQVALPHLQALETRVHETTNLMMRVGREVRFLASVECDQALRAGSREGTVLPAHLASGGRVTLAALPAAELSALYVDSDVDLTRVRRDLSLVRKRGFAINDQKTERGLTAVGMAVPVSSGEPNAAVSIAMPTTRFDRDLLTTWVKALHSCVTMIGRDLTGPALGR